MGKAGVVASRAKSRCETGRKWERMGQEVNGAERDGRRWAVGGSGKGRAWERVELEGEVVGKTRSSSRQKESGRM